jgi:hypothetical protein
MLKWLDTKEVDEFANWVTTELGKRYPPEGVDATVKKATQRLRKVHDSIFLRIEAFGREHKLNIYKRARLGNRVKWALLEARYPASFVDAFTHEVATVVTVAGAHSKKVVPKK